ncbi:putative toxin-antitoxin system toxin component, PIN family [Mucilaginibacter sp. cycad4]|uniref:putative toxin-antitoxin system toxin component, PIN family n=1 Tax=Mucilaginibacter sp. cycad4 TaxID=3342096 RepID=UPI002AAC3692|nr:putative toxin-antitoxin system toxin component, PIN family [Mucilaginibacter gossypii]WPU99599.1 putative toxin-antitoxin system toxin component, PIN family [Mucilaginibacter gossypii]
MNIVLDSNILLIAIGKKSEYRPIWDAFIDEKYNLIVSDEIVYEYEEIIQLRSGMKTAEIILEVFVEALNVINQKVYYSWNLIRNDPDDNKFFDVAVAANADYLVTNDSHFNIVKQLVFPSVKIISANEFLDIVKLL